MSAYQCPVCDYVYDERRGDPREGFPAGTAWPDVPDDWTCPDCGVREKIDFERRDDTLHGGRHRGEHWNEAMEQGAAAAKTIAGELTPYPRLPWSWSDQHGVTIQVCGRPELATEHEVHGDPASRDASVVFRRRGKVVAVVAMNRPAEFRALRQLALAAMD